MTREMSEPHTDAAREELRDAIANLLYQLRYRNQNATAVGRPGPFGYEFAAADGLLASEQFTITAGARTPTLPAGAENFNREPQPSDGPDYHADHAWWRAHQKREETK